jgi:hypothetical protein
MDRWKTADAVAFSTMGSSPGPDDRKDVIRMNLRSWTLLSLMAVPALAACAESTKDLSPPPLNPHPKEAIHVTVSFDRPEDAKRYVVTMEAHYHNQQRECGYIEPGWNRRFIYPEGTFDIPNESRDPQRAKFTIYLDRYNSPSCNWELTSPDFRIHDTHTGIRLSGDWGLRDDLVPGTTYKAICPFWHSTYSIGCFGRHPVPDTPVYNSIPATMRVPVTVHVSRDSAPMRPRPASFFNNFVKPVTSDGASLPSAPKTE